MSLSEKDDTEKGEIVLQNLHLTPSDSNSADELPAPGTPERLLAERKLVRTLDRRVLPIIIIIYIMNFIDVRSFFESRSLDTHSPCSSVTASPQPDCRDSRGI